MFFFGYLFITKVKPMFWIMPDPGVKTGSESGNWCKESFTKYVGKKYMNTKYNLKENIEIDLEKTPYIGRNFK